MASAAAHKIQRALSGRSASGGVELGRRGHNIAFIPIIIASISCKKWKQCALKTWELQLRWAEPVKVVGVCEACATDSAVGEAVLGVDEKMPSKRARRTQGSPTHWAHIALGVAHHSCVLLNTAKQDKNKRLGGKRTDLNTQPTLKDVSFLLAVVVLKS